MSVLTESALRSHLAAATVPVAVAFTRVASAPSDALVAVLGEVARDGRVDVVRVDVDACAALVHELRVHRVPELLVWGPGGARIVARMEGAMAADELAAFFEHVLSRV